MFVKEIVLNQNGRHAFVVDENDSQWFCSLTRQEHVSVSDFMIDVYLSFKEKRWEHFQCDVD